MAEISLTGDQMLTALEIVAREGPISATEVSRFGEMNRTVAHRLLTTLALRGYVRRNTKGYVLGPAVIRLAGMADVDLRAVAKPVMRMLADALGETVVLHGIANHEAVVIDQELGAQKLVRVEHTPGSRHPLHVAASGWALLAWQSEAFIAQATKAADPGAVAARIATVRAEGHAISHDELQQGAHGIAVPILRGDGSCDASLAVLVPSQRAAGLPGFLPLLRQAAEKIASHLD
jgi:DNA-binding IclR family transcriptional regulator